MPGAGTAVTGGLALAMAGRGGADDGVKNARMSARRRTGCDRVWAHCYTAAHCTHSSMHELRKPGNALRIGGGVYACNRATVSPRSTAPPNLWTVPPAPRVTGPQA